MSEPVDWPSGGEHAAPRSPRFEDTYFSADDGLAETRAVFLDGCALPEAWRGRRHFTIGELGFGTGLNLLAVLDLWRRTRPSPNAHLHMVSVEAYPIAREDAARALEPWRELADLTGPLMAGWPDGRRGWRRIAWPDLGAVLDLAIAEAADALCAWTGRADAWFLDGFSPARNPEMWRDEVLALVAARSARGARAASFTVAGAVRRGLEAQGFAVERRPGFGRKKQRLEARWPGVAIDATAPRIAIIGAGIAGGALSRAFLRLGEAATVFEAEGRGAGASGNLAALVTPRLDAGLGEVAELYAEAFARAVAIYRSETPGAVICEGVLQLESAPKDQRRFDQIASWTGFADGALTRLGRAATAERLEDASSSGALALRDGLVIEPAAVLRAWIPSIRQGRVMGLEAVGGGWRLLDREGRALGEADVVILASGLGVLDLAGGLGLQGVRGQASLAELTFSGAPAAWGGYAIPTRTGLLFGATHDRDQLGSAVRPEDHARNLAALAKGRPGLAAALQDYPLAGRAGIRAATADHLPLVGKVPGQQTVFVLSGLGGRGFTLAPILAEALAADILGLGGPLPVHLWEQLRPQRFVRT